jgi:hypothetical protein
MDILLPTQSDLLLNGGVIYRNRRILIKGFLIERKLGVRGVYLKFKGLGLIAIISIIGRTLVFFQKWKFEEFRKKSSSFLEHGII